MIIEHKRYEKRVGEAELAEARLAKAEPDPGSVNHIIDIETETDAETDIVWADTDISLLSAVSRFDLERAREEADEKKGRAERARQEYGVQVSLFSFSFGFSFSFSFSFSFWF